MSPRLERELAMDDTAAWAQTNRFAAIACVIPEARKPVADHHINVAAMPAVVAHKRSRISEPDEEGFRYVQLPLGLSSIEVAFRQNYGSVFVEGAVLDGGWIDIGCFSETQRRDWMLAIEKEVA